MRPARGPALGKAPLPVTATVFSAILHVVLAVAFVLGARAWSQSQPKTYVVNLVPADAAAAATPGRDRARRADASHRPAAARGHARDGGARDAGPRARAAGAAR